MGIFKKSFILTSVIFFVVYFSNYILEPKKNLSPLAEGITLKHRPALVAHRGGRGLYPENTIAAMNYSLNHYNVDMLETDIHITKDNQFIFIHDGTLDRTTNGTGKVSDYTLEELKQLDFGYHFTDGKGNYPFRNKGIHCNTLKEAYEIFKDKNTVISVEIKDRDIEVIDKLIDYLKDLKGYEKFMCFCCANHTMSEYFKQQTNHELCYEGSEVDVAAYIFASMTSLSNLWYHFVPNKNRFFHAPYLSIGGVDFMDKKMLSTPETIGLDIMYFTVNRRTDAAICIGKNCAGITTDRPDMVEELLHAIKRREKGSTEVFDGIISKDAAVLDWICESIPCILVDRSTTMLPLPTIFFFIVLILFNIIFLFFKFVKCIFCYPFRLCKRKKD